MHMIFPRLFVALAALALAGCVESGTPLSPSPGASSPTPADDGLARAQKLAMADLATRLKVDVEQLEVVQAERVTWPDTSLGCPEEGQMYAQVLVEGYRVLLGHDERLYAYHAGADGEPFLCPSGEENGGHDFVPPPGFEE